MGNQYALIGENCNMSGWKTKVPNIQYSYRPKFSFFLFNRKIYSTPSKKKIKIEHAIEFFCPPFQFLWLFSCSSFFHIHLSAGSLVDIRTIRSQLEGSCSLSNSTLGSDGPTGILLPNRPIFRPQQTLSPPVVWNLWKFEFIYHYYWIQGQIIFLVRNHF